MRFIGHFLTGCFLIKHVAILNHLHYNLNNYTVCTAEYSQSDGTRSLVMVYSKGQIEDEITKKIIQWEKDYKGRGPTEAKTDIIRNMVIVALQGMLSPAEKILSREKEGMALIKKLRQQLVEQGRAELEEIITGITSVKVVSLHTDISTKTGERIFVFVMERPIDL